MAFRIATPLAWYKCQNSQNEKCLRESAKSDLASFWPRVPKESLAPFKPWFAPGETPQNTVSHCARDCFGTLTEEAQKHLSHSPRALLGTLAVLTLVPGQRGRNSRRRKKSSLEGVAKLLSWLSPYEVRPGESISQSLVLKFKGVPLELVRLAGRQLGSEAVTICHTIITGTFFCLENYLDSEARNATHKTTPAYYTRYFWEFFCWATRLMRHRLRILRLHAKFFRGELILVKMGR